MNHSERLFAQANHHNWDDGLEKLYKILKNKDCDRATALLIYWRCQPDYYRQFSSEEEIPSYNRDAYELKKYIEAAIAENKYTKEIVLFDPNAEEVGDTVKETGKGFITIPQEMYLAVKGRRSPSELGDEYTAELRALEKRQPPPPSAKRLHTRAVNLCKEKISSEQTWVNGNRLSDHKWDKEIISILENENCSHGTALMIFWTGNVNLLLEKEYSSMNYYEKGVYTDIEKYVLETGYTHYSEIIFDPTSDSTFSDEPIDWTLKNKSKDPKWQIPDFLKHSECVYNQDILLWRAISGEKTEEALDLISKGYSSGFKTSEGRTFVHLAGEKGNLPVLKSLLEKSSSAINACDSGNYTPLHDVARFSEGYRTSEKGDYLGCLELLVGKGADINARTSYDQTPLTMCISSDREKENPKLAEVLISFGADCAIICHGSTPLILAVLEGDETLAKIFLDKGADKNFVGNRDKTAMDHAESESMKALLSRY